MILTREMAKAILDAFDDPDLIEMAGGEVQVRVTEDPWDGAVYLGDRRTGKWKGRCIGRAFNPCDEIFSKSD